MRLFCSVPLPAVRWISNGLACVSVPLPAARWISNGLACVSFFQQASNPKKQYQKNSRFLGFGAPQARSGPERTCQPSFGSAAVWTVLLLRSLRRTGSAAVWSVLLSRSMRCIGSATVWPALFPASGGATTRHARALTFPPSLHKFPRVLSRSLRCAGSAAVWPSLLPPPLFVDHIFKAPNGGRKSF